MSIYVIWWLNMWAQIHKELTPAYLLIRHVSSKMPRRIFVLYPQNKIRLNVGSIRLAYVLVRRWILGAYLRWPLGGASVDFHLEYAN